MKKAPTYNSLALGSIRVRKRQYVTLVTGIVLAIFFTSSMLLIGQSIHHTYQERYFRQVGRQNAVMLDAENVSPETLLESGYVKSVGNAFIIGVTEGGETAIAYYDEKGEALAYRQCVQGRMPEAAGEIAMERSKLQRLRADAKLGDALTLPVKVPDGNGFLPDAVTKTYTLVGILSEQTAYQRGDGWRFSSANYLEYPGAVVSRAEQVEPGGRPIIHRLLQLSPLVLNAAFTRYAEDTLHHHWTDYFGFQLFLDSDSGMLAAMVILLGVALVGVACMGIAGAFSMMLSERRAQIGMLRAVGATRRQIRRIFGREALVIALTVAPAAIALSHLAVWGLSKAIGGLDYFADVWFLPIELLFSVACVMAAAFMPLFAASRVSPMQAIRETSLLRAKKRLRIRLKQDFWPPSLLARRHLRLYRAKQAGVWAVTALSLMVLTVGFNAAWNMSAGGRDYGHDFLISNTAEFGRFVEENALRPLLTEGDLTEAAAVPLAQSLQAVKSVRVNLLLDSVSEYLTGQLFPPNEYDYLLNDAPPGEDRERQGPLGYWPIKSQLNIDKKMVNTSMYALFPEMAAQLKPYVLLGEIDIQALSEGREVLIVAPDKMFIQYSRDANGNIDGGSSGPNPEKGKRYDKVLVNDMFHPGDTLTLCRLYMEGRSISWGNESEFDYNAIRRADGTVRIGAVLSGEMPGALNSHLGWADTGSLITTVAGLDALGFETSGYKSLSVKLAGIPDEQTEAYAETVLSDIASRAEDMDFYSAFASRRERLQSQITMTVSLFAVLILFFATCVSMVNNAVTGRIRSDKRAIGTLRAVGAPLRVIISSYLNQVGIMLSWGLAAGVLISGAILAYQAYEGFLPEGMVLPLIGVMALYVLMILLFCGVNLRARIRGIVRYSIIDNIREL